jgi:hypothetical protein
MCRTYSSARPWALQSISVSSGEKERCVGSLTGTNTQITSRVELEMRGWWGVSGLQDSRWYEWLLQVAISERVSIRGEWVSELVSVWVAARQSLVGRASMPISVWTVLTRQWRDSCNVNFDARDIFFATRSVSRFRQHPPCAHKELTPHFRPVDWTASIRCGGGR